MKRAKDYLLLSTILAGLAIGILQGGAAWAKDFQCGAPTGIVEANDSESSRYLLGNRIVTFDDRASSDRTFPGLVGVGTKEYQCSCVKGSGDCTPFYYDGSWGCSHDEECQECLGKFVAQSALVMAEAEFKNLQLNENRILGPVFVLESLQNGDAIPCRQGANPEAFFDAYEKTFSQIPAAIPHEGEPSVAVKASYFVGGALVGAGGAEISAGFAAQIGLISNGHDGSVEAGKKKFSCHCPEDSTGKCNLKEKLGVRTCLKDDVNPCTGDCILKMTESQSGQGSSNQGR